MSMLKTPILLLLVLIALSESTYIDQRLELLKETIFDRLVKQINDELTHLNTQYPANIKQYIAKMRTSGRMNLDKFDVNETESKLINKHQLPTEVVAKFKGIIYASKVTFQTFHIVLDQKDSFLDLIVGGAGRTGTEVEMAYLRLRVDAELIPAVTWVNERSCSRNWLGRKKCHDNWRAHPRGYNTDEVLLIKQGLEAEAFRNLSENIRNLVYNFDDVWFNELLIKTVQEASRKLEEKAKIEFENAMNYVKEAKLIPMISQLKAIIERANNYADLIVRKSIENYKKAVEDVVKNLYDKFYEIKDSVIYSVEYLYSYAQEKVEALKAQVERDYEEIVKRVNDSIYKLKCAFSGIETTMRAQYKENFESKEFSEKREACVNEFNTLYRKELDINYYEDFKTNEFYEINKCVYMKNINKDDSNQYFYNLRTYSYLIEVSSQMKCLSTALNSPSNVKYYNKEMTKIESEMIKYKYEGAPHDKLKFLG